MRKVRGKPGCGRAANPVPGGGSNTTCDGTINFAGCFTKNCEKAPLGTVRYEYSKCRAACP